jgi:hypothetical protein
MWFVYEPMKTKFCTKLYEPMKFGKFVIGLHCDLHLQIEIFYTQYFIHVLYIYIHTETMQMWV